MQFWLVLYPRWERFVHTGCVPVGDIVDVNDGSFTTTNAATDVEAKRKAIKVNCVIIFLNIYFVWIRKLCGKGYMRWRSTVRSIFALGVYLVNSGSQRISLGEYCKLCRWNICTFKSLGAVRKKCWHRSTTNNAKHHAHAHILWQKHTDRSWNTYVGTCVWWSLEERVPVRQTTSLSPASVIHSLNLTTHNLFVSTVYRDCRSVSRHSGRFYFTVFTKSDLLNTKHLSCCYNSK